MTEQTFAPDRDGREKLFSFIHIGDLHLTDLHSPGDAAALARQKTLRSDLGAILDDICAIKTGLPDLVYLPGDIADSGQAAEYDVLKALLKKTIEHHHPSLLQLIPGDHDRFYGTMDAFAAFRAWVEPWAEIPVPRRHNIERFPDGCGSVTRQIPQFYYSKQLREVHCVFLDVISAGYGRKGFGLDFRLGADQLYWLIEEVKNARQRGVPCAVFMHCYPHDMADRDERTTLAGLFWNQGVCLVEMGHTHYNELAPDGRTLYATARSVGQNEDGPVGYAVGAIDTIDPGNPITSWRFKQLQLGWPFVLITSPSDRRLATAPLHRSQDQLINVRALVMSDRPLAVLDCECSVDGGEWVSMNPKGGDMFDLTVPWRDGSKHIAVRVRIPHPTQSGTFITDMDSIEPVAVDFKPPPMPKEPGSDDQAIGSWGTRGVRGDQAGPNRSGYRW